MTGHRILSFIAVGAICLLVLTTSCRELAPETAPGQVEPQEKVAARDVPAPTQQVSEPERESEPPEKKPTVRLALKFTPPDSTRYRVITEADRSVTWEGAQADKPAKFQGGHTGNKIEMTFTQRIQSVDDQGNAAAEIEIEALKYSANVRDNVVLDFDSSREQDKDHPLAKLIGRSYTIQISPAGQVLKVIDANEARAAVIGDVSAQKTASTLLSEATIQQRHGIPALPPAEKSQLSSGDSWSSIDAFSFDMMGGKSYEKVYTLNEIKEAEGQQYAIVEMNAVPTTEMAQELHQEQPTNPFEKMFDTTETYTGQLQLNLTAGKVEKCLENLLIEWVIVDPTPKDKENPAALKMTAMRLYHIEQVD